VKKTHGLALAKCHFLTRKGTLGTEKIILLN
jgi:hypothetical protein